MNDRPLFNESPQTYASEYSDVENSLRDKFTFMSVRPNWRLKKLSMELMGVELKRISPDNIIELYSQSLDGQEDPEKLNTPIFNYTALIPTAINENGEELTHTVVSIKTLNDIKYIQELLPVAPCVITRIAYFENSIGQMS